MNFDVLKKYLDSTNEAGIPSIDCAITVDHKTVFRYGAGFTDAERTVPVKGDELYWLFSCTKPITCTAAMKLVTEGKLGLDDKLSDYLPEFAHMMIQRPGELVEAKSPILIRHLFTMTAGFGYDLRAPALLKARISNPKASTRELVRAMASVPLYSEPGFRYRYSLCHDVLAAVVEVVSGMSYGEYLKKNIFDPLGMTDFGFAPTPEQEARICPQFTARSRVNQYSVRETAIPYRLSECYESGGAGLFGNVDGYIRFADAMACGGVGMNSARIISEEGVKMMEENQLSETCLDDFRTVSHLFGYGFGFCGRVHMSPTISLAESPAGEFGWDGAAAPYVLIDRKNHLSIFLGAHVLGCTYAYEKVHPKVRDLTYQILRDEGLIK